MPKSLNPVQSQAYGATQPQTQSFVKARPKSTVEMVEDALMKLHNAKGVTLKRIYGHLLDTYNLGLISKTRESLIKKYLKSQWESKDVVNITGRGLSGRFKLVNKERFSRKIGIARDKTRNILNATKTSKTVANLNSKIYNSEQSDRFTANTKKAKYLKNNQMHSLALAPETISRQATPVPLNRNKSSMFDIPIAPTQVQASTPFLSSLISRVTEDRKRAHKNDKETLSMDGSGTPRSSLTTKRLKLLNRPGK